MKFSAGSYDLNKWLHGGYESEIITVLFGGSGSGKTTFVLLAAVSMAKKGKKVLFIDTEGGFSSERVKQLAGEDYTSVLEHIILVKPTTFSEQKKLFEELNKHLKEEVSLLIVDGMTMLYRLDFGDARAVSESEIYKTNNELAHQIRFLSEIARKRAIPVIVTNQVYRWNDGLHMVGGDILKYWGKCLIELSNEGGKRMAYLRKHRSLPESTFPFSIINEGVRKRGWI